jgi:glycolate oxidase
MYPDRQYERLTPAVASQLARAVGEKNLLLGEGRDNYSRDEAPHPHPSLPGAVVKPGSTDEVATVLKISGGAVPLEGGIALSLERMKRIIEIDEANFCATAEAGASLQEFCDQVEKRGLYYPVYPGELTASLGGNVATNAGGMRAVRYGVTRNFVLGLEAVLASGEVLESGGKFIKSSTGYDLTQLLTGSEGTLAVITKVTLKLINPPGSRELLLVPFPDLAAAIRCVPAILREKILPVGLEFMEEDIFQMVEDYAGKKIPLRGYPAYLMIMLESANPGEFQNEAERLSEVCLKNGASDVFVPDSPRAKRNLLEAREKFYPTIQHFGMLDIADVVVPRSEIAKFVEQVKQISRDFGIKIIAYGHAGDGNVHLHPLGDDVAPARLHDLMVELYRAGIALGGTISGEHGLGKDKKGYLPLAAPAAKIELMRRLKGVFDPCWILNPGKVID